MVAQLQKAGYVVLIVIRVTMAYCVVCHIISNAVYGSGLKKFSSWAGPKLIWGSINVFRTKLSAEIPYPGESPGRH